MIYAAVYQNLYIWKGLSKLFAASQQEIAKVQFIKGKSDSYGCFAIWLKILYFPP